MGTEHVISGKHTIARCVFAMALALAANAAFADDTAARLRMAALAEEGDLLLEESAVLAPLRERQRAEGERLTASEKQLHADVARVEKEVAGYNQAVAELSKAAAEHARTCPGTVSDELVVQCNEQGARIMDQAAGLDRRYVGLEKEQKEVNARVAQHNEAREAWHRSRREDGPKLDANAADTQRWVAAARSFMNSPEFNALRNRAGRPPACAQVRLSDPGAHFGDAGLRQLLGCLKAVQRGAD